MLYPTNMHYSSYTGKLYLWAGNINPIESEELSIPEPPCNNPYGKQSNLVEFNTSNGDILDHHVFPNCVGDIYGLANWNNFYSSKGAMAEKGNTLYIFTTFAEPMEFTNGTFAPKLIDSDDENGGYHENLLIFKMNMDDMTSAEYVTSYEGIPFYSYISLNDLSNKILIQGDYVYLTAAFEEKPLYIYGNTIDNNSGNSNKDALLCKIRLDNLEVEDIVALQSTVEIYPNPVQEYFKIITPKEITKVELYNTEGKILETYPPQEQYEIGNLPNGIYYLILYTDTNEVITKKIIKKQ